MVVRSTPAVWAAAVTVLPRSNAAKAVSWGGVRGGVGFRCRVSGIACSLRVSDPNDFGKYATHKSYRIAAALFQRSSVTGPAPGGAGSPFQWPLAHGQGKALSAPATRVIANRQRIVELLPTAHRGDSR